MPADFGTGIIYKTEALHIKYAAAMAYDLDKASLIVVCNDWVMLRAYHSSRSVVPRLIKSTDTYDRLPHAGSVDRLDICS